MNRKEKRAAAMDNDRTERLLDCVDRAFDNDAADFGSPGTFESVLLEGLMGDQCGPYPPEGHGYPR